MFKKIFKAAKDLVRSPVGQIGIGLLLPGMAGMSGLAGGIGRFAAANPMLTQAGLGLLAGDKPENVLRNVAYGTALGGISNLGQPGGFMGGARQSLGMAPQAGSIAPASTARQNVSSSMMNQNVDPGMVAGDLGMSTSNVLNQAKEPGFLERFGLVNPEGKDFFEKYSPILALGQVGLQVAAASLGQEEAERLYDPNQNPYLSGGTQITDVYKPLEYNRGGGVMDFPEKDGMIDGPGNGQSDDIPAMLSDGEFVMTKQAVMAAGDGDRDKGTKKMYEMMYSLQDKAKDMGIGKF
tara:strand:- start:777 stop:1658 length:882 start_codon:yes stop_codon:yes gene_type:complete